MSYLEAGKILPGPEWERRLLDALGYQPELEPMLVALANLKASETQPHSAERVS
jgi:hypothetical protein